MSGYTPHKMMAKKIVATIERPNSAKRFFIIQFEVIFKFSMGHSSCRQVLDCASPFKRLPWGRCTTKLSPDGAILYLHVFNWPENGKLLVPGLKNAAQQDRKSVV